MKAKVNKVTIRILQDDILLLDVDAIINNTNPKLDLPTDWLLDGDDDLIQELYLLGSGELGSAVISSAGNLPFQAIIHAVGPQWGDTSARGLLANATWRVLQLAEEHQLKSIAVPPISVGSHGYPIESCAHIMLQEIIDFTFEPLKHLRLVFICTDSDIEYDTFCQELMLQAQALKDSDDGKVKV